MSPFRSVYASYQRCPSCAIALPLEQQVHQLKAQLNQLKNNTKNVDFNTKNVDFNTKNVDFSAKTVDFSANNSTMDNSTSSQCVLLEQQLLSLEQTLKTDQHALNSNHFVDKNEFLSVFHNINECFSKKKALKEQHEVKIFFFFLAKILFCLKGYFY